MALWPQYRDLGMRTLDVQRHVRAVVPESYEWLHRRSEEWLHASVLSLCVCL